VRRVLLMRCGRRQRRKSKREKEYKGNQNEDLGEILSRKKVGVREYEV